MTDTQMTTSIDVGPASATGHLRSPLFVLLPVELRLKIYEDVFDGANAKLVCRRWYGAPNHDETHDYPDYIYMLRQSEHHRPLLTCRALYEEAMTLYWSHTVIHMPTGTPRDILQRGYKYPSIGDAVYAIPVHARQYIQHITNVKDCQGFNVKERGGPWWLAKGLSYLPSLKTCRLADVIQTDSNFRDYSPYIIGFRLAGDVWGPSRYEPYIDSDDYFIDYCRRQAYFCRDSHPVVFEEPYFAAVVIQKYRIRHADPEAIKRDPDAGERREPGTPIDLAWPLLVQVCNPCHPCTRNISH